MSSSNSVQNRDRRYLLPWMKISRLVTKHKQHMAPEQIIHRIVQKETMTTVQKNIRPDIVNKMKRTGFDVKLYCVRKQSRTRWKFDRFVTEGDDSEPAVNTRNDALLFFYREVGHDEERIPQIYALTTGPAWKLLKGHIDCAFPKGIGRRILDFRLKVLSSRHLLGEKISSCATYWQTESETFLSFWDCLGDITRKYQMPVKKQSSLYTLLTKGQKRVVNVEISGATITFHKRLSWEDISALLIGMSKIFDGNVTDVEMDKDDPRFDVFDHVQLVNSKAEKIKYDGKMKTFLVESIKQSCHTSRLRLVHKNVESWLSADRFLLESSKTADRIIKEWSESLPTLKTVLVACRDYVKKKQIPHAALDQLVIDLSIRFGSMETGAFTVRGKAKMIELIEGHVHTDTGVSVFRYCGKWYRINVEYLTKIEEQFSKLMEMCLLERDKLPLPWLYSKSKPKKVDANTINYWIRQLNFSETDNPLEDEIDLEEFLLDETNDVVENQLIARLFSQQHERDYNSGYILYNRIISQRTNGECGYLLGDNILMKNIEFFDLLHYTPECTYLIHVKNGFGHSFRDVCSQIRISADFLHCYMNVSNRFDILREFWRIATKKKATPYRQAVRRMYEEVGYHRFQEMFNKEICFVLAYRDNINTAKRATFPMTKIKKLTEPCGQDAADRLSRNLAERDFLEERGGKYYLTDKIFTLTADMVRGVIDVTAHDARKIVNILKERVSKSFISKMEFIQLYSYFRKFSGGANVFSLRIYSIENHNPSSMMQEPGIERSTLSGSLVSRRGDECHQRQNAHERMHNRERPRRSTSTLTDSSPGLNQREKTTKRTSGAISSQSSDQDRQRGKSNKQTHVRKRSIISGSFSSHSGAEYRQRKIFNKRTCVSERPSSSGSHLSHSSDQNHQRETSNIRTHDSDRPRSSGSPLSHSSDQDHQRETSNKRTHDSDRPRSSGSHLSHSSDQNHQRETSNKRTHDSDRPRSSGSPLSHSSDQNHPRETSNTRTHDSDRPRCSGSHLSHSSDQNHQRETSNKRMPDSDRPRSSGSHLSHSSDQNHPRETSNKRTHDSDRPRSSGSPLSHSSDQNHPRETSNKRTHDSDRPRSSGSHLSHSSDQHHQRETSKKRMKDSDRPRGPVPFSSHSSAKYGQRQKSNKRTYDSERLRSSGSLSSHSSDQYRQGEKSKKLMHDSERWRSLGSFSSHGSAKYGQRGTSNKQTYDNERWGSSGSLSSHSSNQCRQREMSSKRMHNSERPISSGRPLSHSTDQYRQREKSDKRTCDNERWRSSGSPTTHSSVGYCQRETYSTRKCDKRNSDGKWSIQLAQKRTSDKLFTNEIASASNRDVAANITNSCMADEILPEEYLGHCGRQNLERQESVPYPKRRKMELN